METKQDVFLGQVINWPCPPSFLLLLVVIALVTPISLVTLDPPPGPPIPTHFFHLSKKTSYLVFTGFPKCTRYIVRSGTAQPHHQGDPNGKLILNHFTSQDTGAGGNTWRIFLFVVKIHMISKGLGGAKTEFVLFINFS